MTLAETPTPELRRRLAQLRAIAPTDRRTGQHVRIQAAAIVHVLESRKERA